MKTSWIKCVAPVLAAVLCALPARAQDGGESSAPKEVPAASPDGKAKDDAGFDLQMLPPGEPVKGLRIPYYAADGTTLQMVFEAATARRIDDANIEMEDLRIDAVDDDQKKFLVQMPQSLFNIETRRLTGENGVLIKRDDFEIRGKQGEFDIRNRLGKVLGNVRMIIYNTEELE